MGIPIVFTFADDPTWLAAVNSITYTFDGTPLNLELIGDFTKTAGYLTSNRTIVDKGTWVFTIKATDYLDTVVTLTAQ